MSNTTSLEAQPLVLGDIELKQNACFINGIATRNPQQIGIALLKFLNINQTKLSLETYEDCLKDYLRQNNKKKTNEKRHVLTLIYNLEDAFSVEDIFFNPKCKNKSISTIYNILDVFFNAKIIIKANDENNQSAFKNNYFELNPNPPCHG